MLPRRYWQDMTSAEIAAGDPRDWVAVLPTAAIEQHGPHLPLDTDRAIAQGHVARVIELLPDDVSATFLPVQAIGWSEEHAAFPGTLTMSSETLVKVLVEIAESVFRAGPRKLVIVNSHGGNTPVIDMAVQKLRTKREVLAVAASWLRFGKPEGLFSADERAFGIHGGAVETSLMLHLRPELVRMEVARNFSSLQQSLIDDHRHLRAYGPVRFGWMAQDLNPAGVVGDATGASAEMGALLLEHAARGFVELLRDVARFDTMSLR